MNEQEFQELISNQGIVVVHFSHYAEMSHAVEFPDDLRHAIDNYQSETRSCCALWTGHGMNLPGSIGVIFKPTFEQIVSVLADDSGSSDFSGEEMSSGASPTKESIIASLCVTIGRYNEWRVRGATPAGIFVADPAKIEAKKKQELLAGTEIVNTIGCTDITLSSVMDAFPEFTVSTMTKLGLKEVSRNGV